MITWTPCKDLLGICLVQGQVEFAGQFPHVSLLRLRRSTSKHGFPSHHHFDGWCKHYKPSKLGWFMIVLPTLKQFKQTFFRVVTLILIFLLSSVSEMFHLLVVKTAICLLMSIPWFVAGRGLHQVMTVHIYIYVNYINITILYIHSIYIYMYIYMYILF